MGRVRTQLPLQENLLAAGVAPHTKRGQVHREVVSRLLRKDKRNSMRACGGARKQSET